MEVKTPYELLKDDEKKQLDKNNKAKMTLYNALPCKDSQYYKRNVKSLALKAGVTRKQTSDDNDSQGGSDEGVDEEEAEAEACNLMAMNFRKLFRLGGSDEGVDEEEAEACNLMARNFRKLFRLAGSGRSCKYLGEKYLCERLLQTPSQNSLMILLEPSDTVIRNCDAVFTLSLAVAKNPLPTSKASRGVTKIVFLGSESEPPASRFVGMSKMSFHQALDLIFKLDEMTVECARDILRQRDYLDRFSEVSWLNTGRLIDDLFSGGIDMVIKDLDLEPKDVILEFSSSSRWKEISKETVTEILSYGDGSRGLIASLFAKKTLK
nr:hypothetical protein [Tanacetum cinerariifolium]